jgi:hypothetical protein
MIRGVRRPEEIAGLGLSHRLTARIGALLKKNTAISLAVLESARPGSPLETLLLTPAVLESAGTLESATLAKLATEQPAGTAPVPVLGTLTLDDGFHVLCLQDEVDAGDGWGEAAAAPAAQPSQYMVRVNSSSSALAGLQPQGLPGEGLFSRAEMDRWRLKLATASAASERIEVIRALLLGPLDPAEKLEVLLQGLSDRDESVRAEAAGLLPSIGVDRDIAESLAGINNASAERRLAAMERLRKQITASSADAEVGCVSACAIAALKVGFDPALKGPLLELLGTCARAVGRNPARLAEVIRVVASLIGEAAKHGTSSRQVDDTLMSSHRLLRALITAVPEALLPVLKSERERCADPVTESFLLQHLLDLIPPDSPNESELIPIAVNYLARDTDEGRDSRAVGNRLARRGEKTVRPLCEAFATATGGAQKYTFLLLDEIWRRGALTAESLEEGCRVVLAAIASGGRGLRMAAMQARFVADPAISDATRERVTETFLSSIEDFAFPLDIENVEMTLSRMGLPALNPLMLRLGMERAPVERVRAARLLGDLALNMKAPRGQIQKVQAAVDNILRRLEAMTLEKDFADRGELLRALGKLTSSPAASKQADAVIVRTLMDAAGSKDPEVAPLALEGLTFAASSRRAGAELVTRVAVLLVQLLQEMVLDIETSSSQVNGETVIEISGGEKYTTILPILIKGMSRLAQSGSCPPQVLRDLGKVLLERWQNICSGKLVWGPGNTTLLIEALRDVAAQKNLSAELRMEILRSFAPRHVQTPIMHAITEVLEAVDNEATAVGALTIGHAILGRRGADGKFHAEDREEILRALTRIAGRKLLGGGTFEAVEKATAFRRLIIDELFKGLKDNVGSMYDLLSRMRDNPGVPGDLRADVDRRLKEFHQLDARR